MEEIELIQSETELFDHIKNVNRISTDDKGIEGELRELIESAKADLYLSGVRKDCLKAPYPFLIVRAISLYTKAEFGFDNPDSEKLWRSYDSLERHLALSSDYGSNGEDADAT